MRKFKVIAICALLSVTAVGTTGKYFTEVQAKSSTKTAEITADKAKEIALKQAGSGKVTKCELDYEDGVLVYEIKVTSGNTVYSMDVDAKDGSVTDLEKKTKKTKKKDLSASATVSESKAKEIALKEAGSGKVTKCELDYEDGNLVYEITIIDTKENKKFSMDIDANNSKIYDYEEKTYKKNNSSNGSTSSSSTKTISSEEAEKIALKRTNGGKVTDLELDYDDGVKIYEIEVRDGKMEYDLEINANTGKIISFDSEYDD